MEQGAGELGRKWHLGSAGVTHAGPLSALTWLVHPLEPSLQQACHCLPSLLSGLLPGPLQSPLIGPSLQLSEPSARCHHCSQINLLNTPLYTSPPSPNPPPPPHSLNGSMCPEASPACGLALLTLQPCPPPAPPRSDPGRPLNSWSPYARLFPPLHLGSHCAQLGMASLGAPLPPAPPHWPTDLAGLEVLVLLMLSNSPAGTLSCPGGGRFHCPAHGAT